VPTREFNDQGYQVRLDLSRQVLRMSIPPEVTYGRNPEGPLSPTLDAPGRGSFVSGSMMAQKAKQFDDGLYAAVELAAQDGAGRFDGKSALLQSLARALVANGDDLSGEAPAVLLAACRLGHVPATVSAKIEATVEGTLRDFLGDPFRSKPIGFYNWSPRLADIFRQDRMLQSELKGQAGIAAITRSLHADTRARSTYEALLTLNSRLTNPLAARDLRVPLSSLDRGQPDIPDRGVAFFPDSRTRETDLLWKLFGTRPIPDGFSLIDEMVDRIRSGQLDLRPTADSGWYDHQTWSLEPLVLPVRMPEASQLEFQRGYLEHLLELFKGVFALTRETHIKQGGGGGYGGGSYEREPERLVIITIAPALSTEPLATYYIRRAGSYRFVRDVLTETFGTEALRRMHRLTPSGPVPIDLAGELDQIHALFMGAFATVNRELGIASSEDAQVFEDWAARLDRDSDLGQDARMMVPVFHDPARGRTKVWVFLGWAQRPLRVEFAKAPAAEVFKDGQKVEGKGVVLNFVAQAQTLAYPVTAEIYVNELLDRDEFRAHCDRYRIRTAILEKLR